MSSSPEILPPGRWSPACMQTKPLVHSAQAAAVLKVIDVIMGLTNASVGSAACFK